MNLLVKIENAINYLLTRLGRMLSKLVPNSVTALLARISGLISGCLLWIKGLPARGLVWAKNKLITLKALLGYDFKGKLKASYAQALNHFEHHHPQMKITRLKKIILTPFFYLSSWLKGLSVTQTMLLLTFSAGSLLAGINIVFSGKRIMSEVASSRAPASVEANVDYERPAYYKLETRHLGITNLRLPVYIGDVNELKSVDIDFTVTLSNRKLRQFISAHEWQLRDHFILQVEPLVATFPLEDEGKEILRQKLFDEMNIFIKNQGAEGKVEDLQLTYILAN
jgi:flagellar basal body-associated protein FliL